MTNNRSNRPSDYSDPSRFETEDSLAKRESYLRRLKVGVVLLLLLAIPAIFHSHAAMQGLMNRPPEWLPNSLPEKKSFNEFVARFDVADVLMIAWDGSDLGSPELALVSEWLASVSVNGGGAASASSTNLFDEINPKASAALEALMRPYQPFHQDVEEEGEEESGVAKTDAYADRRYPFIWVRSGDDTLQQLTSAPANFPRSAAVRRLQGSLIGDDGQQSCLLLALTDSGSRDRRRVMAITRELVGHLTDRDPSRWHEISMVGGPMDGAVVDDASIRSVQIFAPPSAIVAVLLCYLCLRSVPLTAVIVAIAVISEGLVMAAVHYTGTPMNAVLIVLPPLVFVLTISSGIHLSNYYLDAATEFADLTPSQAAERAMRAGTTPCLLAAGTTIIGLGSLMLVRLDPIQVFGFVAAIGVATSLLLLLWCLPGAMVLTRVPLPTAPGSTAPLRLIRAFRRGFQTFVRSRLMRPWPMIAGFALITVGASAGLSKLESSVSIPRMFLPESDLRRQYNWFEEHVGATVTGDLLASFPTRMSTDGKLSTDEDEPHPNELVDPLDQLRIVQILHRNMLDHPRISSVLSAASFVPPIKKGRGFSASASRSIARQLIRDPGSSLGELGFISHGVTDQTRQSDHPIPTPDIQRADNLWRLSFRFPQKIEADHGQDLEQLQHIADAALSQALDEVQLPTEIAEEIKLSVTGHVAIVQKAQEIMLQDLFRSFLTAFAVVGVVMIGLLKNLTGGLVAMIPNLFPTVTVFGVMGLMAKPLDIGSVMTASVALGIAVDDTIHLLSRYGSRRARGLGQVRATFGALDQCGWAMLQTTLVCGVALLVYWFSDFVPTSHFAVLMFCLLSAALFGDVFLLPALMSSSLGKYLSRSIGTDPGAALSDDGISNTSAPPPPKVLIDSRETVAGGRSR